VYLSRTLGLLTLLCLGACQAPLDSSELPDTIDYNWHVKPILSDRCYVCHGPDDRARQASLRLDTQDGAYGVSRNDSTRHIIVPGDASASVLMHHISSEDPSQQMPPPESNLSLSQQEIDILRRWIDQGAVWKPHWAFTPPQRSELPEVHHEEWVLHPIDAFILSKIELAGLTPSKQANPEQLLRRVTFDLTGLPPTPSELNAFLADTQPAAYERVVDQLLSRPTYGQRMASMWLDIARYADTHGYQDDRPRTMWPWRDWVVRAFNENLPYDEFVTWQIAGDLLPNPTFEQRLATGFNRNHAITQEGGVVAQEYLTEYVADRTNTTGTAFLGLTMECARCHDHKYDPILIEEYYGMFAFFNGIDEQAQISYFDLAPQPSIPYENPALEAFITRTHHAVDSLEEVIDSWPQTAPPLDWTADPNTTLNANLLDFLPLDTIENLATPSVHGRHGKANTGLEKLLPSPKMISGRRGHAMEFDGENFLNIGEDADFEWYDRFSLSSWIWTQDQPKNVAIVSKRNGEQKRGGYDLARTDQGNLLLRLIHDNEHLISVSSTETIPHNQWVHVSATYDGSGRANGVRLYINGLRTTTRVNSDNLDQESILNGNGLLVGHWTPRNQTRDDIEGMKRGAVDDLYVHARDLTALEVAYLADQPYHSHEIAHYQAHHDHAFQDAIDALDDLRSKITRIPHVMIMEEMEAPRTTFVLDRGAYDAPMDSVGPSIPEVILPFPEEFPRNRLGLAQWITHDENPLTARVAVNRFWQLLFGAGLVQTPEDFGNQGALPTHPELLDHLAVTFIDSDYDIKALIKQIVMSATYRQSNQRTPTLNERDPDNLLLARAPRKRLSAEMIRDNALLVSGLLNPVMGGEPVRPYQPAGLWKALANQIGENRYRMGPDVHRRSIYTYWKRTIPPPSMLTFDAPDRSVCTVERQMTSTPLQSLILLNDPQYVEAARVLASRVSAVVATSDRERIGLAFQWLTSRVPQPEEINALSELFTTQSTQFKEDPDRALQLVSVGQHQVEPDVQISQLAAMTVVTSTIMNLDEAQYR